MPAFKPNQDRIEERVSRLLDELYPSWGQDESMEDTPRRVATTLIDSFSGLYAEMPKMTDFRMPKMTDFRQDSLVDQVYITGPIPVRALCAHHLLPIVGQCWIGVMPGSKLLGLSKFSRLAEWVFNRPSMQEEMTARLADVLEGVIKPKGIAVLIKASHMCMTFRGVKSEGALMRTSVLRGTLLEPDVKNEFFEMLSL